MISVVIPAFNEEKTIAKCLESLVAQKTKEDFEVIVVDNNSTDKTSEIVATYKNKLNLKLILEKQKGRSPARLAGFSAAKGNIIFSTDADAVVPNNWIDRMLSHFDDKKVVAVSGICKISDCSWRVNTTFNFLQPFSMKLYRLAFGHYWLSGFNFAIRKDIYEKSGGFDPSLNAQEDTDLAFRVYKLGKIKFIKDPFIFFSGRRFNKSLTRGLFEYVKSYYLYLILKDKKATLSDVR